jgi:hypothetical protein
LHQLPKIRIDAAATLQLSRLAHPFRGVKRLLMQLNRLAPGLRQQSQQQRHKEQQPRKWSWRLGGRGFGMFWNTRTATTTTTNFALTPINNKMGTLSHLSFTRLSNGSCADVFELHRLPTTDLGNYL